QGSAFDDISQESRLAQNSRRQRFKEITVPLGSKRLAVRWAPLPLVVCVADEYGTGLSAVIDKPSHFADELALGPDVLERVGAHGEAKRAARERERGVPVAADPLATWCGEPPGQPYLREIEVRQHRRGRREGQERPRQMP